MNSYEQEIFRGLDRAFADASARGFDLSSGKYIIFSDHHKGRRDGADDFWRCERAYNSALGYYLETGYTLLVLGDAEELWECRAAPVLKAYEHTLSLEAEFHKENRYLRFYGNHDDLWESRRSTNKYLNRFFGGIDVLEGLRLSPELDGKKLGVLFVVHGHQGTTFGDRHRGIAKWFVRHVWRPIQRITRRPSTTPAIDFRLRERHDLAMHSWAQSKNNEDRVILIAGHTHRPVFLSRSHMMLIEEQLNALKAQPPTGYDATQLKEEIGRLRAELEWVTAQENQPHGRAKSRRGIIKPCYFNTGCCSFGDGDVTGLEISNGDIKLVRWPNDDDRPQPKILSSDSLRSVFDQCG